MHELLKRQLKKHAVMADEKFIATVNKSYHEADEHKKYLESSLKIALQEKNDLFEEIQKNSKKKLKITENKYERLVHELREHYFFYSYDKNFKLTCLSDSVLNVLGYDKSEGLSNNFTKFYTDDVINEKAMTISRNILAGGKSKPSLVSVYHKDGSIRYLEVKSFPLFNETGEVYEVEGIARDVTEQYSIQKQLNYISNHDPLTEISNRYSLYNQLEYIINDSKRNHKSFALFYIDVDNFKLLNDTLGHDEGDIFLKIATKEIKKNIRQNDVFARIGGDEFIIVLTDINDDFISTIAKKILHSLEKNLEKKYTKLGVSLSIGITTYPENGQDMDNLIKNADTAMYSVKKNGKNGFSHYRTIS